MKLSVFKLLFFQLIFSICPCHAQKLTGTISIGDRATTLFPFAQIFNNTFYPVMQLTAEYQFFNSERHSMFQTIVANYHYHRLMGSGLGLRTETGYRLFVYKSCYTEALIGVGYLASIPSEKQFKLEENGNYTEAKPIISTLEMPLSLGIGYSFSNLFRIFIRYQYSLQLPYNKTAMVIPSENLFIGFAIPLTKK